MSTISRLLRFAVFFCSILFIAQTASATTYYICAATGSPCNASDTSAGTSQTAAWLHAPGMPTATGNVASYTPQAGDRFIFRGGDTWWRGSNTPNFYTTADQPVCQTAVCGWIWSWSGTSENRIYIGVDQTWFNSSVCGTSWCRPKFNLGNPLTTSTTLTSCTVGGNDDNPAFFLASVSYVQVDNLDFLGQCFQFLADSKSISSASASGGTATITTSAANSFIASAHVTISGVSDSSFNGNWTITSVVDSTHFRFALAGAHSGTGGTATSQSDYGSEAYMSVGYSAASQGHNLFTNLYFHGWSHKQFNCTGINPSAGMCNYAMAIVNSNQGFGSGDLYDSITIDGSDSDRDSFGGWYGDVWEIKNSLVKKTVNGVITNGLHSIHDSVFDTVGGPADNPPGGAHTNDIEVVSNGTGQADSYFYNLVLKNCPASTSGLLYTAAGSGQTDWIYNNIIENSSGGVTSCQMGPGDSLGSTNLFNNTMDVTRVACYNPIGTVSAENNILISDNGDSSFFCSAPTGTVSGNVYWTESQATDRKYTPLNVTSGFPDYKPQTSDCNHHSDLCPVSFGANLSSSCSSTPGSTLCSDTSDGNSRTPVARPTTDNWDAGAWQH